MRKGYSGWQGTLTESTETPRRQCPELGYQLMAKEEEEDGMQHGGQPYTQKEGQDKETCC